MTDLEKQLANALENAIEWNDDYKKVNNLAGGDPYWVSGAKAILYDFAAAGGKLHQTKPVQQAVNEYNATKPYPGDITVDNAKEVMKYLQEQELKNRNAVKKPPSESREYDHSDPWINES